ncbi:MAG: SGNH/GDSL hydrolase family protein [Candidatus Omnitrophica bacterium]|nr:SGNH/GDSL hydrolase family protein [Candidatus Omnitrophota bacterium]MCM8790572.1 SGNH/GDSL hydrolase family protein [Candidatus Omnitrophota bacterium]
MGRVKGIILAMVIGLVFTFFLSELIVRILWARQIIKMDNLGVITYEFMRERSDPDLTYELKPNLDYRDKEYHIVTNSDGFRDKEYAVKKAPGVKRILVLGDSITFGYGIRENEDVFYNVLENMLNGYEKGESTDKKFEVIGIAAPGYNTYTELSILKKKGVKYSPDIVIFTYCLNDARDSVYSYEYAHGVRLGKSDTSLVKLPSWLRRLLRRSVLYSYIADKANRLRNYLNAMKESETIRKASAAAPEAAREAYSKSLNADVDKKLYCPAGSQWYEIYINSHKGRYLEVMDNIILRDLEETARKNNFKILFVIFPAFEKETDYYPEGGRYLFTEVHATLKDLFAKHGFYVLDLKEAFQGRPFSDVALDDCHPSLKGHRISAEAIFNYLKQSSLLNN